MEIANVPLSSLTEAPLWEPYVKCVRSVKRSFTNYPFSLKQSVLYRFVHIVVVFPIG